MREHNDRAMALIEQSANTTARADVRLAKDDADRQLLWKGRKGAFGALGLLAPTIMSGRRVPRGRLPEIMARIADIAARYELLIANVFHYAGDGICIPIFFRPAQARRVGPRHRGRHEILKACIEVGGSITGGARHRLEKKRLGLLLFTRKIWKRWRACGGPSIQRPLQSGETLSVAGGFAARSASTGKYSGGVVI